MEKRQTTKIEDNPVLTHYLGLWEFLYNQHIPSNSLQERMQILRDSRERARSQSEKELTIEITNNCSLNCVHCSTEAGPDKQNFMHIDDIMAGVKEFSDFQKIRLSGGEPFNHPDFPEILKKLKGKKVEILSCGVANGKSIDEKIIEQALGVDNIVFSLQGDDSVHNKITRGDYWKTLMESVARVIYNKIPHSYHTVAMSINFDNLPEIAANIGMLRELAFIAGRYKRMYCPVSWHLLRFVKQGRGRLRPELVLTEEQRMQLPRITKELSDKYLLPITMTNSFEGTTCDCNTRKAVITYDGTRIGCSALKYGQKEGKFACKDRI